MGATNPGWKKEERAAAAIFGGRRHPANVGGPADFETPTVIGQVKFVSKMPLAELEREALAMEALGFRLSPPKIGVVVAKRKRGKTRLVILTEAAWREMNGQNIPSESCSQDPFITHGELP